MSVTANLQDKESPSNYATRLATELQRIPFEDVVSADYLIEQYKPGNVALLFQQKDLFCFSNEPVLVSFFY